MGDPHRALALAYVLSFAAAGWLLRDVPTDPWFVLSVLAAVPLTPVVGAALAVATGLFCGLAEGIHDRRRNRDE